VAPYNHRLYGSGRHMDVPSQVMRITWHRPVSKKGDLFGYFDPFP